MAKKQNHAKLVKAIRQALEWDGWSVVPIRAGPFSRKGIADIYADKGSRGTVFFPTVIWIEAKISDDQLTKDQKKFFEERRKHGVECYIIRQPEDLQEFGLLSRVTI
jgi:hypothetical protein